jgi:hypothetical protein
LERVALSVAAIGAFVVMLPVVFRPHGMFAISLPRYALFLAPIVFSWAAPLLARLRIVGSVALVLAAFVFSAYAIDCAINDRFAPLDFALWARQHPDTRIVPFDPDRAASVADRMAGPKDKIALDAGYSSWIHPAFGARLTRPVFFIPPGEGPPVIPEDAQWVVIDRGWGIIWEAPGLEDLSQAERLLLRGQPTADELRVRRFLMRDPRFKLVYVRLGTNQLVFRRVR